MSDDSEQTAADAGESDGDGDSDDDSSGGLEPGGGPQRVVSDQSVDDILNSLDETNAGDAEADDGTAGAAATERRESASTTIEFDEDDVPEPDGDGTDADTGADGEDDADPTGSENVTDRDSSGSGTETDADAASSAEPSDTDATSTDDSGTDDATSVDAAASSLPDGDGDEDESLEELAARIEDGTVTGADVRAAEAGEGRESTPEVDEIDLSMDDLEATGPGPAATDDLADDAGPLAGSVRDAGSDASDADGDDDRTGVLGRLKRLFFG